MIRAARYTWATFGRELTLLAVALLFLLPFYLLITISLKSSTEVYAQSVGLPAHPSLGSYSAAWAGTPNGTLWRALINSLIITISSVVGLIVIGSLTSYVLARRLSRLSTSLYVLFLLGLIIPFQLGIIPLYVTFQHVGLNQEYAGMILLYIGLLMPLTVFLYTSFIRALPSDYEEASYIDGAGKLRTFVRVVFPLLRPATGTVVVLTAILIWNDFFTQLIFLSGSVKETLPVAIYSFVGEFASQWNVIFAAVVISILPTAAFFLLAQRQFMRGFSGGVKG